MPLLFISLRSTADAGSILDRKVPKLSGDGGEIYTALCNAIAGSCGVFIDQSLVPIVHKSTFSQSTVREILQKTVPPDGPYQWREKEGVINIAPKYVFAGEVVELMRRVSGKHENKLSVNVAQKVFGDSGLLFSSEVVYGRYKYINIRFADEPVMDALNRIAKADGAAYWWIARSKENSKTYSFEFVSTRTEGGTPFPVFRR